MSTFEDPNSCSFEFEEIKFEEVDETSKYEIEFNCESEIEFGSGDSESEIEVEEKYKVRFNEKETTEIFESIKLLADSSVFDYYSIETISELELHLRTLVSLIEVICKSEIRIRHDLREKIYAQLGKFAEIHFRSTEVNEQGFNKVFKSEFEDFNLPSKSTTLPDLAISNESKIYKDGKRITPGLVKTGISHGADLPINSNGIELLFKNLQEAFTCKYPISSWYHEWRTLLELHFNIQSFLQECKLSSEYGENLLLECLWHRAIEVLIKLSQRKMIFYNIIENDFKTYKKLLDSVKGLKSHHMIEAIREKSFYDHKLVDISKNYIGNLKEQRNDITTDSLASPRAIIISNDSISDIIIEELSCPITYQISKSYQILSCCKHFISPDALQRIIDKRAQPNCPLCREIIDLNSLINLPQSATLQGIQNHLAEDNYSNAVQEHNQNISNENNDEEINISKLKSQQTLK
ncbi:10876_t:CDS:2, partial [Dentiscutata heterogama]